MVNDVNHILRGYLYNSDVGKTIGYIVYIAERVFKIVL